MTGKTGKKPEKQPKTTDERGKTPGSKDTQFKPGNNANPSGRPKGRKNFKTLFYAALERIGEKTGVDPEDIEMELIETGIVYARKGDYKFWKDVQDRVYGQSMKKMEVSAPDGEPLFHDPKAKEVAAKYEEEMFELLKEE